MSGLYFRPISFLGLGLCLLGVIEKLWNNLLSLLSSF